ncbi:MAG: proliferating cell nuclear antigen (pcna) [Candidatus Diapherotrites archaeon]|nr:proliferating cell nuclear antigen (pcna) [Candidatus Diapherotrites archaeon]
MFEIAVANAKQFKSCVDAISTLIDEGEFELTNTGLQLRAMDPSQIAMVDFVYPKHAFERYEVSPMRLGVNLEDLAKVMARVRPEEKMLLKLDESKTRLVLTFKGAGTRRFVVPLLDIGGVTPKEPNIEFESQVKFNGNYLKEALKDTSLVSSHVILRADKEGFTIEAQGDKGEVSVHVEKDNNSVLDFKVKDEPRAMFPLEYLNELLKSADASTNVDVFLRTDAPLKISYNIGDANITYFLAPRIETQ